MRTIFRDNYDPVPNEYHEKIVIDEARNKQWLFDCDGIFTDITGSDACVVNEKGDSTSCAVSQKLFTDETNQIEQSLPLVISDTDFDNLWEGE